ncbi:MAG: translation initiation factor IF-2 [Dehalococcoidia bacterium]|nr:translation initiation factor IF-2 [Dehalococcoidia bacterium]
MPASTGRRGRPSRPSRPSRGRASPRSAAPVTPPPPAETQTEALARPNVTVPRAITVQQLGNLLGTSGVEVIKHLMRHGVIASINRVVNYDAAAAVATDLGFEPEPEPKAAKEAVAESAEAAPALAKAAPGQVLRPPVVTIMGHVDHGKTSLLDAIRQSKVTDTEAGGITQHIGAYQVEVKGQKITFLDTPGHEAFTAMRARGAQATDIAILVVAADDGVMPQTIEAIDHARAAGVPIIVAMNKIDKPTANPDKIKQQLGEHGLVLEEWGGDVILVPVSAKKKQGIQELLENLLVVAELADLKSDPNHHAEGIVIEAELDSSKGPIATVLVKNGTLKLSDRIVVGESWGKVKAMFNDKGQRLKSAGPSTPVEVMGLPTVPAVGERFLATADDKEARSLVDKRRKEALSGHAVAGRAFSLDELSSQIRAGQVKELGIILKTDVQGSIEPIKDSLERLKTEEAAVRVIHSGSGNVSETDVNLAVASRAIIIGFNTRPDPGARKLAEAEGVDIRVYTIIYDLIEDVRKALAGLLEPKLVDVVDGHAEIRQVFSMGKRGKIAGVSVNDGALRRGGLARVLRGGAPVAESSVTSLKHFKEDVKEMRAGFECGLGMDKFNDFQVGDIVEAFHREKRSAGSTA